MSSLTTKVKVSKALPSDYYAISTLESKVFYNDPFSIVGFGPNRTSEAKTLHRADRLGKLARKKGETAHVIKATLADEQGKEEIVGSAVFTFVRGRKEGGDELIEKEAEHESVRSDEDRWGPGANVKFCEDVFLGGDLHMIESVGGEDYAKLGSLVVSDEHQRRGIGSQLLEKFLEEADASGLQAVLGASKQGKGLYKRYGFTEYHIEELRMWEYEGGEGMEADESLIMHRPAQVKV